MKRTAITLGLLIVVVLAVCNSKQGGASASDGMQTLPFKVKKAEAVKEQPAAQAADGQAAKIAVKPPADYAAYLDTLFEHDSSVSHAYQRFRKELPAAKRHNMTSQLFSELFDAPAWDAGKDLGRRNVLRQWVKDGRAETDEEVRLLYSQYCTSIRLNNDEYYYRQFYTEKYVLRPGEDITLYRYDYYNNDGKRRLRRYEVEFARLKLDSLLKPLGFVVSRRDSMSAGDWEHRYHGKMDTAGVYRVTISGDDLFQQLYLQVSWIDCVVKTDAKTMLVFGASYKDTLPPPYTVHCVSAGGETFRTTTDSSGLCALRHNLGVESAPTVKVILEKDGQLAFMEGYFPSIQADTSLQLYLYTDRPIYRPGHTVHFRGMLKHFVSEARLLAAEVDSFGLTIRDPQGTEVYKRTLAVDQWGHFGDSISLGETARQGVYYFQYEGVRNAPRSRRSARSPNYSRYYSFMVEAYKKPEFTIKVKADKEVCLVNEEATFNVTGEYYFGGALADVPVTVRWYQQSMYHYWSSWGEERCCFWPSGGRQFVKQEQLRLDKQGKLVLRHKGGLQYTYGFLIAEVIAVDQSRREVREEAQVKVVKSDAYLAIMLDKYEYELNEEAAIEVVAVDLKGKPLAGPIELTVKRGKAEVLKESLTPNAQGRAHAKLKLTEAGQYTLTATAKDSRGTPVSTSNSFQCVKKRSWDWDWERVELSADREQYSVGDTATITVKAGADKAPTLCTVEGRQLWSWSVRSLSEHTLSWQVPLTADMGYNVQVGVVFSGKNRIAYSNLPLMIIDSSLVVKVKLDAKRNLEPGAAFNGTLQITDRNGKPLSASFSVALVDEAIYDVARVAQKTLSGYYGYHGYYGNRGPKEGVLSMLPAGYSNRVPTRYSEFSVKYLAALMGIAAAAEQAQNAPSAPGAADEAKSLEAAPSATMAAGAPAMKAKRSAVADKEESASKDDAVAEPEQEKKEPPRERKEFKDLGFWNPSLTTDSRGQAKLSFTMPDDLTKWRLVLVGSAGQAYLVDFRDSLITKQNIMVKLEAPRGFVVGDSSAVASVIHNYAASDLKAKVSFELKPGSGRAHLLGAAEQTLTIKSGETVRADWPLQIDKVGKLTFYTAVYTDSGNDAESRIYPVLEHGIPKSVSESGVLGGGKQSEKIALPTPGDAAPGSRTLTIEYSLSLAASLFEGLEYLTGYPYGCVEQTMSRFLPNLLVASTMKKLGLQNDSLMKMIPQYTAKGLERLKQLHHGDGGWGWWENDQTDPRMTALVVHGLALAVGTPIDDKAKKLASDMLERGCQSVRSQMEQQKDPNVRINLAASLLGTQDFEHAGETVMNVYGQRAKLGPYSLAMLLECLQKMGKKQEVNQIVAMLEKQVVTAGEGVHWGGTSEYAWYSQDEETTARVLRALLSVNPEHPLAAKAVTWLSRSKRSGYWVSTKTTAVVIEALACYVEQTRELDPDFTGSITLNGKVLKEYKASRASLAAWQGKIVVPDSLMGQGNDVEFAMKGKGRLYYSVTLRYSTAEKPIKAHANGLTVSRSYTRIVYTQNQNGDWEVKREPFKGKLRSGDELEVSVKVKSDKNYEHMLLEDYFASGMEVLKKDQDWYSRWCSWWWWGYTHSEARDDRYVWFLDYVGTGERTFTYLLRAETPGVFAALPAKAELMYQPKVSGNSEETVFRIGEMRRQ